MNVRATRITADAAKVAADRGELVESYKGMVERMKKVEGFLGACMLADRETGNGLGLTFWSSEQTLRSSEEVANKERARGAGDAGATAPPTVERYEVLYYGVPEPAAVR